jgi:flagellar basal body-associated protein FliL
MKLQEKGTFEYLKRKKNQNLLIMLISFAVVFAVFFAGLAVFKSRNNYCTLIATVLVLPAAKFAVAYFVLLPHKSATKKPWKLLQERLPAVTTAFFQTAKVRLVHRQLLSQTMPSARSHRKKRRIRPFLKPVCGTF